MKTNTSFVGTFFGGLALIVVIGVIIAITNAVRNEGSRKDAYIEDLQSRYGGNQEYIRDLVNSHYMFHPEDKRPWAKPLLSNPSE